MTPMMAMMIPTAVPFFLVFSFQLPNWKTNAITAPIAMIGDMAHRFDMLSPIIDRFLLIGYSMRCGALFEGNAFGVFLHYNCFINHPQAHGYIGYAASQGPSHKRHPQLNGAPLVVARIEIVNAETAQE